MQLQSLYDVTVGWFFQLIFVTNPAASYANPAVQQLWTIMLYITDTLSALFLVIAGYQILFSVFNGQYAQILSLLPRVVFAVIAAHMSLYMAKLLIDFNNLLCADFYAQRNLNLFLHTQGMGLFLIPFLIALGLLMFFFCLMMVGRTALLDFLLLLLPLFCLLLAIKQTEHIGRAGLEAYVSTVFVQAAEILLFVLANNVIIPFFTTSLGGPQSALAPLAALLLGVGLFVLMLQLPIILSRIVLHPVVETGGAMRTLVTMLVARLI